MQTCYYPAHGEDIASIIAADQLAASDPGCAMAGCSLGVRRVCCEAPDDPGPATYAESGYSGGLNHLTVERTGADGRCTRLSLAEPHETPSSFAVTLPDRWGIELALDCTPGGSGGAAIGGLGSVTFATPCTFDVDMTLFFAADGGAVEAVRFVAQELDLPAGIGTGGC